MIGGDLLATGSSSCIFRPSIPCKGETGSHKNKVSKIVYGEKALKYYTKEKNIAQVIKKIKGYSNWCIISETFCDPPSYDNIFKYDKQILSCKDRDYEQIFDDSSKMMTSKYGGVTFEDYFNDEVLVIKDLKHIEMNMYKLLKKMKYLFIGLTKIHKSKLVHLDIKYNNIVLDGKYFKYIDFGLSSELIDSNHFRLRSLSEFKSNRLYLWYPLEYLYSVIDDSSKIKELSKLKSSPKFRKHYNTGVNIHKLFGKLFNDHAVSLLKSRKIQTDAEYKELVSSIDVYSLGIMIPFFFIDYSLYDFIFESAFLKDLFILFRNMCEFDHRKRIKPDECLNRYNKLMKKYSHLDNSKGKKTKKRR